VPRRRRPFNPAYVNPADAQRLGALDYSAIAIETAAGAITAVLQCAPDVREGVVSIAHGFDDRDGTGRGACTSALIDDASGYEPLSGLPRMSAIPVRVRLAAGNAA
jgi:anaerobic selenocysteine-containing dehydrogenase